MSASGILIVVEVESERAKVGVWCTDDDGMLTVVHLGTVPSKTMQSSAAGNAEELARMLLSEFR